MIIERATRIGEGDFLSETLIDGKVVKTERVARAPCSVTLAWPT